MNIPNDAHDLAPGVVRPHSDALPECCGWVLPHLACEGRGNDGRRSAIVNISPCKITAGDERNSDCGEESWCNELFDCDRRRLPVWVVAILCKKHVLVLIAV